MTDYISRDEAIKASKMVYCEMLSGGDDELLHTDADDLPVVFVRDIEAIPAADVKPVVRGQWEKNSHDKWHCSICGMGNNYAYQWCADRGYELQDFYCPNCGAYMKTVNEESVNSET